MSANPAFDKQAMRETFEVLAPSDPVSRRVREQALEGFLRQGFPSTRMESWRYTNLRTLARRNFSRATGAPTLSPAQLASCRIPELDGHLLVFLDGHHQAEHDSSPSISGLSISRVKAKDDEQSGEQPPAFRNLNTAFCEDATRVEITANAHLDKPVYLLFISSNIETPVMVHPRLEIVVGAGADLKLVEHHMSLDADENLVNTVIDINLARGARLSHTRIQDTSNKSFQICRVKVEQARDSHYSNHHICLGAALARMDIDVRLREAGAEAELHGLMLGTGRQHMDTHTQVDHIAPQTRSREAYRCVLDGKSRGVFNGKVVVHKGAQKIEAHQASDNLLLSPEAEIDTKPELEIYADDVKCSHGATVGQLDQDALFYLLSRGIEPDMARALLVFAFADKVVAGIDELPIRHAMERRIVSQLPDGERLREFV